jgi:hypothetical protein
MRKRLAYQCRSRGIAIIATAVSPLFFPAAAVANPGAEAALCYSQLEFLKDRGRVTSEEAALFYAQCACIEQRVAERTQEDCTASFSDDGSFGRTSE